MALGLYTALPGFARWDDDCKGGLAAALPAVGLVLGLIWWGVAVLARAYVPSLLGAAFVALLLPVLTGFLHLDGYMDVADARLSSRPQEDKLRILKDPHTGAFAVIALAALLLVDTGAGQGVLEGGKPLMALAVLPVVSRAMAGYAIMTLSPLPQSGYARMNHETATGFRRAVCIVWLAAAVLAGLLIHWRAAVMCLAAMAGFALMCWRAVRALGGMNGDIAGASICCAEACGLIALACL